MLDYVKYSEDEQEIQKFKVNGEYMIFANNPSLWQQIYGDEQQRMENEAEFYHPSSQAELEEMMKAFRNPEVYSKKPS